MEASRVPGDGALSWEGSFPSPWAAQGSWNPCLVSCLWAHERLLYTHTMAVAEGPVWASCGCCCMAPVQRFWVLFRFRRGRTFSWSFGIFDIGGP